MGLRVNTNVSSINAQRNLFSVNNRLAKNFNHLSTGLRVATAADDAAGLAISERLRSQIRSLSQAERNANDAVSLVQTGEGALNEVSNILVRMRELAVQASNGTVSSDDKATLHNEFEALRDEITRISNSTEFNGIKLLDGSSTQATFQVGIGTSAAINQISVTLSTMTATALSVDQVNISTDPSTAIDQIDEAINSVSARRGAFGAVQNRLSSTISNLANARENLSAAESRIRDVDVAYETADMTRNSILKQAAISVLSQANMGPQSALALLG
jgi:flagellin